MSSPIWRTHNKIQQIPNPEKDRKLSERINATNPKIRSLKATATTLSLLLPSTRNSFLNLQVPSKPGVFNTDVTFSFWTLKSSHGIYEWEISRQ
ncbi:hypothetical protein CEXT_608821 [Caerostris extrusa]|uniref:Uncharacterized protein n=1 Tax=Caerostris extrusa TaxID=172846 RepID=A0AAV4TYP2_CAEEX|nr:hypothetical protein CEXT_608821 [Caerostris extrusa]